jgi:hypothetical protein
VVADQSLNACTIASSRELARALVLGKSFLDNNPGSKFFALIVDGALPDASCPDGMQLLESSFLELPNFLGRAFSYDAEELTASLKARFLLTLLESGCKRVVFLDRELLVLAALNALRARLDGSEIVLVPRQAEALPARISSEDEKTILLGGVYETGVLAVRDGVEARRFLRWWEERLERACYRGFANGHWLDRGWVSFVPAYFRSCEILRQEDHRLNSSREVRNGAPVFFDARGLDLDARRFRVGTGGLSFRRRMPPGIVNRYLGLLQRAEHWSLRRRPYRFGAFSNGCEIHPFLRRVFRELAPSLKNRFADPFDAESPGSFYDWARSPDGPGSLTPFLRAVYEARPDVADAFPRPDGPDREAFLRWAAETAPREMAFEDDLATCLPWVPV